MARTLPQVMVATAAAAVVAFAPTASAATNPTISATAETIDHKPAGTNDADDPAFWVHPSDPAKSLIIGTVKQAGLDVYRTDGSVLQTISIGSSSRYNNVDVLYGITLGGTTRDLAVVTDRGTDKLHVFAINGASSSPLTEVTAGGVPLVFGGSKKIPSKTTYGISGWRNSANGNGEVFVTQENTTNLAKLVLTDAGAGKVGYQKVASISLPDTFTLPGGGTWKPCFNPKHPDWTAHAEGMVVDPATGTLWADQEIVGLWKMTTDLTSPQLVHKLTRFGQTYSTAGGKCKINAGSTSYGESYLPGDLEGIGMYRTGTTSGGYLVISNQQKSVFTVFSRDGQSYLGTFAIGNSSATDAVDATDGLDVINVPMGSSYPQGLLVTQDGKDAPAGGTNFKLTPWPSVAGALGLQIDTGGGPRG
jgi:3-phytase